MYLLDDKHAYWSYCMEYAKTRPSYINSIRSQRKEYEYGYYMSKPIWRLAKSNGSTTQDACEDALSSLEAAVKAWLKYENSGNLHDSSLAAAVLQQAHVNDIALFLPTSCRLSLARPKKRPLALPLPLRTAAPIRTPRIGSSGIYSTTPSGLRYGALRLHHAGHYSNGINLYDYGWPSRSITEPDSNARIKKEEASHHGKYRV